MSPQKILILGIACFLVISSLAASGSSFDDVPVTANALIRIDISKGYVVLPKDAEYIAESPGEWVDIIISGSELQELINQQIPYSVLIPDMDAYHMEMMGSYHTFAQIQTILQGIADDYPSITNLFSVGTSYQNRTLWCLEITDNPGV
jgi:hypothetical protein